MQPFYPFIAPLLATTSHAQYICQRTRRIARGFQFEPLTFSHTNKKEIRNPKVKGTKSMRAQFDLLALGF
jgi:hypothetical protein